MKAGVFVFLSELKSAQELIEAGREFWSEPRPGNCHEMTSQTG
jgi:hypothetical protein